MTYMYMSSCEVTINVYRRLCILSRTIVAWKPASPCPIYLRVCGYQTCSCDCSCTIRRYDGVYTTSGPRGVSVTA